MDETTKVLLAALIGAAAGIAGQLLTARYVDRNERRRLAVETGFREWERVYEIARSNQRAAALPPPVLFVHYNHELLRLLDSRRGLTAEGYERVTRSRDALHAVIRQDSDRLRRAQEADGS